MSRWRVNIGLGCLTAGLAVWPACAQDANGLPPPFVPKSETAAPKKQAPAEKVDLPPEEDTSGAPKVYSFNPVQSISELKVGNEYFVKGNFTAAANRFREATRWNDGNAEAWMRLGEAEERKSNVKAAREAYEKYLELSPNAKNAADIRKRLTKLKG